MTNCQESMEEPATQRGQKSVAVLFVDIEGCTRLCEDLPPKEMNELIEAYFSRFFDVVEKVGGTITNIMGDGFMAIFEKSEYGNNILGAAEAASSIQRQARELNAQRSGEHEPVLVNAGIHAGIAYVGITKYRTLAGRHRTYTALGPVINIAARLCDLATNGSIFVSGEVADNIADAGFSLERLGPRKLKNVSQTEIVFKLNAKKTHSAGKRTTTGRVPSSEE